MKKQLGQYCYTQHLDKVENVNKNAILEESNFIVQDLFSPKFFVKYYDNCYTPGATIFRENFLLPKGFFCSFGQGWLIVRLYSPVMWYLLIADIALIIT